jgi:hypothetical protein
MKNMKPLEPWKPAKAGEIEHSNLYLLFNNIIAHLMDMASKKRKKNDDDDDEDENKHKETMKKSIFERENIFRKPYEKE